MLLLGAVPGLTTRGAIHEAARGPTVNGFSPESEKFSKCFIYLFSFAFFFFKHHKTPSLAVPGLATRGAIHEAARGPTVNGS